MGYRSIVITEAFLRLLEVPPDDVRKLLELRMDVRLERIQVIHGHHAGVEVPPVLLRRLPGLLDVGIGS